MRMTRERERGSHSLDDEGQGLDDEGQGLDDEGQGSEEEGPGFGYGVARRHTLESTKEIAPSTYEVGQSSRSMPEQEGVERISAFRQPTLVKWTLPSPEWLLGSLLVSPLSLVVPSPIALPVATPAATISIDEDQFLEVGAQLELRWSILHDHTQRLDVLPPTLFEGYDRDLRELYTRENHDLRRQLAKERRERLELTNRVARMERRQEFGGE
ncbi:hypothetical protein Tco_1434485 [Tanacetum coccineum]